MNRKKWVDWLRRVCGTWGVTLGVCAALQQGCAGEPGYDDPAGLELGTARLAAAGDPPPLSQVPVPQPIGGDIVDQAAAGEVLVSGTTRDLAEGATGLAFEGRGRRQLKGLERELEFFVADLSA